MFVDLGTIHIYTQIYMTPPETKSNKKPSKIIDLRRSQNQVGWAAWTFMDQTRPGLSCFGSAERGGMIGEDCSLRCGPPALAPDSAPARPRLAQLGSAPCSQLRHHIRSTQNMFKITPPGYGQDLAVCPQQNQHFL